MRYWWVNQNQTYRQEISRGYLWSPKRTAKGVRNPFYESMREVSPGDLIFSYTETRVPAIGIAESFCFESPKPQEFGSAGPNWENIGWRVRVKFTKLLNNIRPKEHINVLRPLLPAKYAPLQSDGNGLQSVYLTELPSNFAEVLMGLIGTEVADLLHLSTATREHGLVASTDDIDVWEQRIAQRVEADSTIVETDRQAIVNARRGHGLFKQRVMALEQRCRITLVERPEHLIASHCKPWRDSSNEERLDGENGLLLTPSIDHLFDRGFISFEDSGELIISPVAHTPSLQRMGVPTDGRFNAGSFSQGQKGYLDFHRTAVLLKSAR